MIFHMQKLSRSKQPIYLLSLFHVRDFSTESIPTMRIKTRSARHQQFKELYVFLLKSVIPSNEKPFSHSLSLKGKTQCFILSFSIEFAHFLQDGPMDCHESRVQLSVATLINWMGLQHSWLGLAEINSHCNLRVRPPNLANQPIMNAWYPFPKGRNLSKFVGNSGSLVG